MILVVQDRLKKYRFLNLIKFPRKTIRCFGLFMRSEYEPKKIPPSFLITEHGDTNT